MISKVFNSKLPDSKDVELVNSFMLNRIKNSYVEQIDREECKICFDSSYKYFKCNFCEITSCFNCTIIAIDNQVTSLCCWNCRSEFGLESFIGLFNFENSSTKLKHSFCCDYKCLYCSKYHCEWCVYKKERVSCDKRIMPIDLRSTLVRTDGNLFNKSIPMMDVDIIQRILDLGIDKKIKFLNNQKTEAFFDIKKSFIKMEISKKIENYLFELRELLLNLCEDYKTFILALLSNNPIFRIIANMMIDPQLYQFDLTEGLKKNNTFFNIEEFNLVKKIINNDINIKSIPQDRLEDLCLSIKKVHHILYQNIKNNTIYDQILKWNIKNSFINLKIDSIEFVKKIGIFENNVVGDDVVEKRYCPKAKCEGIICNKTDTCIDCNSLICKSCNEIISTDKNDNTSSNYSIADINSEWNIHVKDLINHENDPKLLKLTEQFRFLKVLFDFDSYPTFTTFNDFINNIKYELMEFKSINDIDKKLENQRSENYKVKFNTLIEMISNPITITIDQKNHKCDPDKKKNFEFIKTQCKNCPLCKTLIYRPSGCNQMFCSNCKTKFCWKTLLLYSNESNFHNPEYESWLKEAKAGYSTKELEIVFNLNSINLDSYNVPLNYIEGTYTNLNIIPQQFKKLALVDCAHLLSEGESLHSRLILIINRIKSDYENQLYKKIFLNQLGLNYNLTKNVYISQLEILIYKSISVYIGKINYFISRFLVSVLDDQKKLENENEKELNKIIFNNMIKFIVNDAFRLYHTCICFSNQIRFNLSILFKFIDLIASYIYRFSYSST